MPRTIRSSMLGAVLAVAALASPAHAATFVVMNLNDSGPGSLRDAILAANMNGEADTITFDGTLAGGVILLSTGELSITNDTADPDLTIDGDLDGDGTPAITVSAQDSSGVFLVAPGAKATLGGLVIIGGNSVRGGGIFNHGTLSVTSSAISGNRASGGGGINNDGTLSVTNSTISSNSADTGSAGGGGIANEFRGTVTVTNSTISGNSARGFGGGIGNFSGTFVIEGSTISGNSARRHGGGIRNQGTLTVTNSTISANSAVGFNSDAGGIDNEWGDTVTVTNSTISGNRATRSAGGIRVEGTSVIEGSTISGNEATVIGGGGIFVGDGTHHIKNTIVAGNQAADCIFSGGTTLTSLGFNLEGGTSCGFTATGDLQSVAVADVLVTDVSGVPLLADNGGPTGTIALVETGDNPAINAIPPGDCIDTQGQPMAVDQRGVSRPQPATGNCDIGAFELVSVTIADVIERFDRAVENGTLRGAGPGNSAEVRLKVLRNKLLAAGERLEQGDVAAACTQLQDAADRIDGAFAPPDFVQGPAAPVLLDAVIALRANLGCGPH